MNFKDITPGRWSEKAIQQVAAAGLMSGFPDGSFAPDHPLTREQFASVLSRLMFRDGLFSDILPKVMSSIVVIQAGSYLGTGVFISSQGHIITNTHVVINNLTSVTVKREGKPDRKAEITMMSTGHDLFIFRCDMLPDETFLKLNPNIELGQHVGIIGHPYGLRDTFTQGQVSHVDRGDVFQTDAPINPGNSGGAAINEYGELIGVTVSKSAEGEGLGFCIKAQYVIDLCKAAKISTQ